MKLPSTAEIGPTVAPVTGWLRIGLGAGLLVAPRLLARALGVDSATARQSDWLARMIAGREVALGVGTLVGARRLWLTAQMISDGTDMAALLAARRHHQVHRWLAAAVIGFAGAGVAGELVGIIHPSPRSSTD
ncbi:MAG: hypothetical protein ACYCO3_13925 [Mycobacteriales bacterium]